MHQPIRQVEDLTEAERDKIVFDIMHYQPSGRVRDLILKEVIRFKWLDSEQYGLNIYSELDAHDQLVAAGFEWRRQHWENFYAHNDTDGQDQPRSIRI